ARALLRYRGFQQRGFRVVALFDADSAKVGQELDGLTIHAVERIPEVVAGAGVELGVITVPSESAQAVADALVTAGVKGILNFAPTIVRLPERVSLVSVDLTVQLEQLAFLVQFGGPRHRRAAVPGSVTVAQEILVLFVQVRILAG